MTDIRVEMAVSVAMVASWRTDFEHDSIDVMENPMGLYWCGADGLVYYLFKSHSFNFSKTSLVWLLDQHDCCLGCRLLSGKD